MFSRPGSPIILVFVFIYLYKILRDTIPRADGSTDVWNIRTLRPLSRYILETV